MRKLSLLALAFGMFSSAAFAAGAAPWPVDGSQLTFVARLKDKPAGTKFMVKVVVDQRTTVSA